ncbi:MAG: peptidase, partial [Nitrospinaceae bacterium]
MSKETLAKLMAVEDINVENRKVQTASFDLKSRTLVLPIWKDDLSEHVTDLLVGHEVAHALYSPASEWFAVCEERKVPKSYVNILEDIRIEKSIKKKFPGL